MKRLCIAFVFLFSSLLVGSEGSDIQKLQEEQERKGLCNIIIESFKQRSLTAADQAGKYLIAYYDKIFPKYACMEAHNGRKIVAVLALLVATGYLTYKAACKIWEKCTAVPEEEEEEIIQYEEVVRSVKI